MYSSSLLVLLLLLLFSPFWAKIIKSLGRHTSFCSSPSGRFNMELGKIKSHEWNARKIPSSLESVIQKEKITSDSSIHADSSEKSTLFQMDIDSTKCTATLTNDDWFKQIQLKYIGLMLQQYMRRKKCPFSMSPL